MRSIIKIITPFLIFSITSCSFLNNPHVEVTIDSDPIGAKIYIDDIYYGNTARVVKVVPDKSRNLRLEKDGYETINIEMKPKFSMRKGREGSARCNLDLLGSFLILPIIGLKSVYCRSFTEELYNVELLKIAVPQQQSQNFLTPQAGYSPPNYTPFSTRNYYLPLQQQNGEMKTSDSAQDNQNTNYSSQPTFNRKSKIGYYR